MTNELVQMRSYLNGGAGLAASPSIATDELLKKG